MSRGPLGTPLGRVDLGVCPPRSQSADSPLGYYAGMEDRGRKDRLSSVPPPSEPCMRISRTRLSSQWFYLEED